MVLASPSEPQLMTHEEQQIVAELGAIAGGVEFSWKFILPVSPTYLLHIRKLR